MALLQLNHYHALIENKIFTILAIGRLAAIKGFDCLINELSTLAFYYKLTIIGGGPEKRNLERLIQGLKLREKIKLAGFRTDITAQVMNADLVVMSSHSEGAPIATLKAPFLRQVIYFNCCWKYPRDITSGTTGGVGSICLKNYHHSWWLQ